MDDPVAFIDVTHRTLEWARPTRWETPTIVHMPFIPLYIAPPKKEWQGLTEEEIMASLPSALRAPPLKMPPGWRQFADALETILKEKNNENN